MIYAQHKLHLREIRAQTHLLACKAQHFVFCKALLAKIHIIKHHIGRNSIADYT